MANNIYIVIPAYGAGSNDMVIIAKSAVRAEEMYWIESNMTGEYYADTRKNSKPTIRRILPQLGEGVVYERQDNL